MFNCIFKKTLKISVSLNLDLILIFWILFSHIWVSTLKFFFKSNHLELLLPVWTLNIFKIFWISLPGILHFELWNFFTSVYELRNIFKIFSFKVNLIWTLKIFLKFFETQFIWTGLWKFFFWNFFQLEVWLLNFEIFFELNLYIWLNIAYTCWIVELLLNDVTVLTPLYLVGSFPHSLLQTKLFQIFSDLIVIQWKFEFEFFMVKASLV